MSGATSRATTARDAHRTAHVVGRVLGVGVSLGVLVIVVGLVLMLLRHPGYTTGQVPLHALIGRHARFPVGIEGLVRALRHGSAAGVVLLGVVVILASPIVGAIVAAGGFLAARDLRIGVIALVVVLILLVATVAL